MSTLYSTVPHVTFDQFHFPCKKVNCWIIKWKLDKQAHYLDLVILHIYAQYNTRWSTEKMISKRHIKSGALLQKRISANEVFSILRNAQGPPRETWGAFHSTKTFENLETAANGTEIFPEKFPEIPKTVKFPKCEPFNEKF